jgi:hypothetical protein
MNDEELLEKYIATFPKFDEMVADEFSHPAAIQLAVEDTDLYDRRLWKPVKVETPVSQLDEVYAELPARFPRLFELMVCSYRWAEVDLGTYRLMANPARSDPRWIAQADVSGAGILGGSHPCRSYPIWQGT